MRRLVADHLARHSSPVLAAPESRTGLNDNLSGIGKELMNTVRANTSGSTSDAIPRAQKATLANILDRSLSENGLQHSGVRSVAVQSATIICNLCDD
jgi:hypothetical protein